MTLDIHLGGCFDCVSRYVFQYTYTYIHIYQVCLPYTVGTHCRFIFLQAYKSHPVCCTSIKRDRYRTTLVEKSAYSTDTDVIANVALGYYLNLELHELPYKGK